MRLRSCRFPVFAWKRPRPMSRNPGVDACACAPMSRLTYPLGVLPRRQCQRRHAKRVGLADGIARHACLCGAWISYHPCALPPTPRQSAAWRRLRGLPRCFFHRAAQFALKIRSQRRSRGYAAGARSILRWGEDISAEPKQQILFAAAPIAAVFKPSTPPSIFFRTPICNPPRFGYKRRTAAKPCFGSDCWGIVQW